MSTSNMYSNEYLDELHKGNVDWDNDSFKAVLMDTGYTFDRDTDSTYSDISADELGTGNGYTQNTKTLSNVTVTQSNTNNRFEITFDDVSWTASGGSIGPSPCMLIIDDTHGSDIVVGCVWFGADRTATDGNTFDVENNSIGE